MRSSLQRIVVIGSTCSGKTTLARNLSFTLNFPHIELDELHWGPNWRLPTIGEFTSIISESLGGDQWIADGNYSKIRHVTWSLADTIIWLDYPLPVNFFRLLRRTLRRIITKEELWHGNREHFRDQFLNRNSLFVHLLKTHSRRRISFQKTLRNTEFKHLAVYRFSSQRETDQWVAELTGKVYPCNFPS